MPYAITTQKQIRALFWETFPDLSRKKIKGDYPTDTRCAFVDFVEVLCRDGQINDSLAQRATL